jgi:hypothetical protein
MVLLTVPGISADEPSKAGAAAGTNNPGWNFKLTPNSGPLLAEPAGPAKAAPPFAIQRNTKLQRKGEGEPTFTAPPLMWWTGDYMTPLEKSRMVIPRSDRVRQ